LPKDTEVQTLDFPACKITKANLEALSAILEKEAENDNTSVHYELIGKGRQIVTHSMKSLLDYQWPRILQSITMKHTVPATKEDVERSIFVDLKFDKDADRSKAVVQGYEHVWIGGIIKEFQDALDTVKTTRGWLHNHSGLRYWTAFLLTMPLTVLIITLIIKNGLLSNVSLSVQSQLVGGAVLSLFAGAYLSDRLVLLYPYIEIEDHFPYERARAVFYFIMVALAAGMVYEIWRAAI